MIITRNNYFVLTGAMGGGKTAILNKLKERGYKCIDEQAREIIKEQVKIGGDATPNKNGITPHFNLLRSLLKSPQTPNMTTIVGIFSLIMVVNIMVMTNGMYFFSRKK